MSDDIPTDKEDGVTRYVYVNGAYRRYDEAQIHAEDRGFQFADAVYEVCEIHDHAIVDEDRHLARLERSLGELGIAKDVRDRLQNHAYMDVSAKHYDRYDYMAEKRAAAERWCDFLEVTISGGNVVPIRKAGEG